MIAVENQVVIQPVSVAAIFDAPNSSDLFQANAAECLVPGAQPQRAIYDAMERAGVIMCFAAYSGSILIGFISVICTVMPHLGKRVATIESVFVDSEYRSTGAGNLLLDAAEQYAVNAGCIAITEATLVGSGMEKILSRRVGYRQTHSMHTKWLAGGPA